MAWLCHPRSTEWRDTSAASRKSRPSQSIHPRKASHHRGAHQNRGTPPDAQSYQLEEERPAERSAHADIRLEFTCSIVVIHMTTSSPPSSVSIEQKRNGRGGGYVGSCTVARDTGRRARCSACAGTSSRTVPSGTAPCRTCLDWHHLHAYRAPSVATSPLHCRWPLGAVPPRPLPSGMGINLLANLKISKSLSFRSFEKI